MHDIVHPTGLDLNNCDREPIHIPEQIQPFGTLIAGDAQLKQIMYAAENVGDFLGRSAAELLGSDFRSILGSEILHSVRNSLAMGGQRLRTGVFDIQGTSCEVFAHLNEDGLAIVELEKADAVASSSIVATVEGARAHLARAADYTEITDMLDFAVHALREMTGYDRVMPYRYAADQSGEVVAESVSEDTPSFLGLRYPAWDVPKQARALQVRQPLRMLSDINQKPIPLCALSDGADPLNLSAAHLRGISSIHVEYLRNMGVGASLTIGLIVDEQLWGMFSCHHLSPKVISSDLRIMAEIFGQLTSLMIKDRLNSLETQAKTRAAATRQRILAETDSVLELVQAFQPVSDVLRDLLPVDGFALVWEDHFAQAGDTPSEAVVRHLAGFAPENGDMIEVSDNLVGSDLLKDYDLQGEKDLNGIAGCAIVRVAAVSPLQLLFFKQETLLTVNWAGKPEKEFSEGPLGPRITPRGSFEAYVEEQTGRSEHWTDQEQGALREIHLLMTQVGLKSDRGALERSKAVVSHKRHQDLMIAELNHRVKNILALIRSLSRKVKASSDSIESYALALEQRINALATAHDLAVTDAMRGVSLRSILQTELGPYQAEETSQAILSGPLVGLRADVAPMLALVFHELISNAAKYGALSSDEGIVKAQWSLIEDKRLEFSWRELGGPPVKEPERHGFGRSLIENAIPYEFDGECELVYDPAGVRFSFSIPAVTLVKIEEETEHKAAIREGAAVQSATAKNALVVEDNMVLSMDMIESLKRLGANSVQNAGSIQSATKLVEENDFDFAVLDMNLRGEVVFDIALALQAKGTPFIFVSGYGSDAQTPHELSGVTILAKPVSDLSLSKAIAGLFA